MPPVVGLVAALGVTLVACAFGRLLLRRWLRDELPFPVRLAIEGWAGLTALAYLVLLIGVLGYLRWQVLLGLIAAVSVVSLTSLRSVLREIRRSFRQPYEWGWATALWGMVGIAVIFALAGALNPPTTNEWDSLSYHLAAPKVYVAQGQIARIPYDHHTNSPFSMEMLYTLGLAFGSESLAKGFHFAVYLLLIASVAGAAKHWAPDRGGNLPALSAAIVATLPPITWEAGTAYVDLGTALGEWLALVLLIEWWRRPVREGRWLGLAGVLCGTALATKVLGGIALLFACGAAVVRCAARKDWSARALVGLTGLALLVGAPWYVRSFAYTGNPIYPYAYSVFGGADWDTDCARIYRSDQKTYGFGKVAQAASTASYRPTALLPSTSPVRPPAGPVAGLVNALFRHGVPNPLLGIPLVPLFLTFDGTVFWERPMAIGLIGPLFLAFLPALFLFRPLPSWAKVLLSFALFSLVAWWFTTQLTRYLIPAFVALAVPTAFAIERLASRPGRIAQLVAFLSSVSLAFCVLTTVAASWPQLGVALGTTTRERAIRAGFEQWELFDLANRTLGKGDRVALHGEPRGYYLDVPYFWADIGYHTLLRYDEMQTPDDLLEAYRAHGITAVLVNKTYARATYDGTDIAGRLLRGLREEGKVEVIGETRQGILLRLRERDAGDEGERALTMKERLIELILRDAYREGDFTLRSGQKSDYYIDLRVLALEPEAVTAMADLLLDRVVETEATAFGGPTVSSIPILGAMCVRAHERGLDLRGFFVREAAKEHGTGRRVEGPALEPGTPVVILDDICSTGSGARMAIEGAEGVGLSVVKVLFVVDREMGGSYALREDGYAVESLLTISEIRAAKAAQG